MLYKYKGLWNLNKKDTHKTSRKRRDKEIQTTILPTVLLDLLTPRPVSFSVLGVFLPDQRLSPVWMKTINER